MSTLPAPTLKNMSSEFSWQTGFGKPRLGAPTNKPPPATAPSEAESRLSNAELIAERASIDDAVKNLSKQSDELKEKRARLSKEFYNRLAGEHGVFTASNDTTLDFVPGSKTFGKRYAEKAASIHEAGDEKLYVEFEEDSCQISQATAKSLARQLEHFAETGKFKRVELGE